MTIRNRLRKLERRRHDRRATTLEDERTSRLYLVTDDGTAYDMGDEAERRAVLLQKDRVTAIRVWVWDDEECDGDRL